jgi:predicted thioredoxin/glutaredoxin
MNGSPHLAAGPGAGWDATLASVNVELVTRRGCHLCEDALRVLRELGLEPDQRDVDADPELFRLYDFRVPVVLVDGRVLGEGRLDRDALSRALRR